MTNRVRFKNLITGVAAVIFCLMLVLDMEDGVELIITLVDATLILSGIRLLVYYFTMARFMTGGIVVFYRAIFRIDLGLFVFNIKSFPREVTLLYLIVPLIVAGASDILHAIDMKKADIGTWIYEFSLGLSQVAVSLVSVVLLHSVKLLILVYSVGLMHTAVSSFYKAFFYSRIKPV